VADFRSDPSDSPEGKGRARRAWDAYVGGVDAYVMPVLAPVLDPAIRRWASKATADLVGFWVVWHLHGGFEGLVNGGMHPTTVWRKIKRFRLVFGEHPDTFSFPGVTIDPVAYWDAARTKPAPGDS
jgi:hypothetical protein